MVRMKDLLEGLAPADEKCGSWNEQQVEDDYS